MPLLKPSFLRAAPPARQHGVVLFVALIVMVALSLAAIALIRSVDTTTTVIGNLAFRQASILPANMAVEEAAAALFQDADVAGAIRIPNRDSDLLAENYFAFWQNSDDARGVPAQLQKRTAFTQTKMLVDASLSGAQTEVRYVIERMCLPLVPTPPGPTFGPTNANCDLLPPQGPFGTTVGDSSLALPSVPYYRVTIRVDGPQNTASFVQAMLR
jgi:type IV pilus assembly protein PilX